jgi:Domain of unknown function (DUF4267)
MENTLAQTRSAAHASLDFWMIVLLASFLLVLAASAFFNPVASATGFGIPLANPLDAFYFRVKGDRDLASALAMIALTFLRERRALGWLIAAATLEPIFDALLSIGDARGHVGYALAVHGSAALYGAVLSWRLLRRS